MTNENTTQTAEAYTPENLKRWTLPDSYMGAQWPEYFVFFGRHRDSNALERANFDAALKAIGGEQSQDDELPNLVQVARESHWAVGWIEWIAIHQSATEALRQADEIKARFADYPVVDEELFSEYEQTEASEIWKNCYNPAERVEYIREHKGQFEFRGFADLLGCVRGNYLPDMRLN